MIRDIPFFSVYLNFINILQFYLLYDLMILQMYKKYYIYGVTSRLFWTNQNYPSSSLHSMEIDGTVIITHFEGIVETFTGILLSEVM